MSLRRTFLPGSLVLVLVLAATAVADEVVLVPGSTVKGAIGGRVRGTIQRKVTSEISFKGYRRHASKEEPQYVIKSDKTDHLAIHKGSALKKVRKSKGSNR